MTDADAVDPRKKDRSATRVRAVRVSDDVWLPALSKAKKNGQTLAEVIRAALIEYADVGDSAGVRGRGGGRDKPSNKRASGAS